MPRSLFALLALALLLLPGCAGYTLGPIKPKRYENIQTVAVSSFTNETLEPRLEVMLANLVIRQIQQDGTYRVTDEAHADAILECKLEQLDRRSARSVVGNVLLAKEYTLTLRGRYLFRRRGTGEQLESRSVAGSTSFFVSGSSVIAADVNQDERQAVPLAARDLAVRLVAQITEGW